MLGCWVPTGFEISLGDTIGAGRPATVSRMLKAVLAGIPATELAGHFHDTENTALDNVAVSLDMGLRTFDSAVGGLGGCPYAPGAKGNLSTSALLDFLEPRGFETGINRAALQAAECYVAAITSKRIERRER